jgi:hypothetical protein
VGIGPGNTVSTQSITSEGHRAISWEKSTREQQLSNPNPFQIIPRSAPHSTLSLVSTSNENGRDSKKATQNMLERMLEGSNILVA